ncbi:raffinose/stachyose/melibiose transport system substrate-binding protein [Paenibacillus sp. UNCCL117]|uniref:ABC transporter substrate-binding protein n=1 Tax=unclassified Paenibacillus TaxID=185978 RepID=UPI00088ACDED|nr:MULTISPECIES: ABC transporter substrate-binding protein [unclassified Paenibacillus]SDD06654.1 raffinose/stachyose/melibiose transport system substrate-binding protein [Paenibacillus sp. cl123]SFW31646.1 raffinose/stachyose/melibiose transport system substrate-binding protein [Paenibacillus sp. UNCCL117]
MTKRKLTTVLTGAVAMSLALSACGGGSGSGSAPADNAGSGAAEQKKNVAFTIGYATGDPATKQAMADSIAAFTKANPHIKITDLSEGGSQAYLDWLKTKDAVNEFPDLVEMRDTQLFADAGKLAELPAELLTLFSDAPKVNGKNYTAPIAGSAPQGIIYSKKAYADAGVTALPKTYDEFLAIQEKLKTKGITPITFGGKDIFHWGFWVNKFLMDEVFADDPNWNSKRTKGQVSFTDAGPKKAMESLNELFAKGYIDKGYLSTADNQTASMLVTGKAAQLFSGPWMFPQIAQADPKFEFGWYAVPDRKGRIVVNGLNSQQGWALSSKAAQDADKKAAMTEFIKFFFSKEQYASHLKAVNGIPTTKEAVTYEATPQMKSVLEVMSNPSTIKSLQINAFWGENTMPPQWRNWYYKLIQDWLVKGDFSDEYLKKMDAEWDSNVKANAAAK